MKANFILFCLNEVRIYFSGRKLGLVFCYGDLSSANSADLRKPFASEIFVKLSKTVRANDSQTYSTTRSTIWKIIFFATSERQTLCKTIKGIYCNFYFCLRWYCCCFLMSGVFEVRRNFSAVYMHCC